MTALLALLTAFQFHLPNPTTDTPAPEYLNWKGFAYLPPENRTNDPQYPGAGDWTPLDQPPQTITLPFKVLVIRRIDEIRALPDGALYEQQPTLETPDVDRIQRAVKLLALIVQSETHGIQLQTDVSIEQDPVIQKGRTLDQIVQDFAAPRFNGGNFQADDKVYRGPYAGVLCIVPESDAPTKYLSVNGTPLAAVSAYGAPGYESDGVYAARLANVFAGLMQRRAREAGILGPLASEPPVNPTTGLENPLGFLGPAPAYPGLAADPSADDIEANLKLKTLPPQDVETAGKLSTPVYKGPDTDIHFGTDPDRGGVLVYSEKGTTRTGGLDFPTLSGDAPVIDVSKTPTFEFWVKSNSPDPLGVSFSDGQSAPSWVCLGQDRPGDNKTRTVAFAPDGAWHQVKIDLKATGLTQIRHIAIGPTPNSLGNVKQTLGPIEFDLAEMKAASDAPDGPQPAVVPDPDSSDPWARAIWAHAATPSPKLLTLLADPAYFVRLNAVQHYLEHPDPAAEPALTQLAASSIDGPVGASAVLALWKLGTDTSKQVVHQYIRTGVTEQGRAEAANLVAQAKDPESAPEFIALQQARTVYTRMDAVRALAMIPGKTSDTIRATFLFLADPETHLVVTETSDPNDDDQVRKLLWSAVNETSDAVRLAADEKLLQSSGDANRKEGLKGIKDDSLWVRIALLQYLAAHPKDENLDTILIGVSDKSPRVRAAAIKALAAQSKAVTVEQLGDAVNDRHPDVELALLELSSKKGIKLPDPVLEHIKASADPRIVDALKPGTL